MALDSTLLEPPAKVDSPALMLGCPVWGCERWRGSLYTAKAPRDEWLAQYTQVFSTVEVNSSFYALPTPEIVEGWAKKSAPGFQFCLKFPKALTHDAMLIGAESTTRAFIGLMRVLQQHGRLGPAFLQLSPQFSARQFVALARFLYAWPDDLPISVEARHSDYFDEGECERRFDELLISHGMDRCLFDSRALFSAPPTDEAERESQRRKPRSPFRVTVTGSRPMVRFVGRNDLATVRPWIEEWATIVGGWIEQGLKPIVFAHAPDDVFAPEFARLINRAIREKVPRLPELPLWPGEVERSSRKTQRSLF